MPQTWEVPLKENILYSCGEVEKVQIKMAVSLGRNLSNWLPCNHFEVNVDKVLKLTVMSNAEDICC